MRGSVLDYSISNAVNIESLDGVDNTYNTIVQNSFGPNISHSALIGRAIASATCSWDMVVGASGEDMYGRVYEFSGVATATVIAGVLEEASSSPAVRNLDGGSGTSVPDTDVTTTGADRLCLNFIALNTNQAVASFTGESGGDWTEAVAEFASATGALCTLQLQTASKASAGTISGGSMAVTTTDWANMGTALISPSAAPAGGQASMTLLGVG